MVAFRYCDLIDTYRVDTNRSVLFRQEEAKSGEQFVERLRHHKWSAIEVDSF